MSGGPITLTGTEMITVYPQRPNSPQGTPTAAEAQATTQAIADLASGDVTLGGDLAGIPTDATVVAIGGHPVDLGGSLTTGGAVDFSGAYAVTLVSTGVTDLTLPASGTLQTTALTSTDIWVGNSGGFAQARAMSGDAEISNTGVVTVVSSGGDAFGSLAFLNAAPAGTLTGTTLASNVVNSSLTGVGTLTSGALGSGFIALGYSMLPASADIVTIPFSFIGLLTSGQVYAVPVTQAGMLLANGGTGFTYKPGTIPTAPQSLLVQVINTGGAATTSGTIAISTSGSVTPPTYSNTAYSGSGAVALTNQGTADATFASWAFGIQMAKT